MIFFNSSLPRSCSTLLQCILGQNPKIAVTPTDGSLDLLYAARDNLFSNQAVRASMCPDQLRRHWLKFCRGAMEGWCSDYLIDHEHVSVKSRGMSLYYQWYSDFMGENLKVISMVRAPEEIFASAEVRFRESQWGDMRIENHSSMTGTSVEKRIDIWANSTPIGLSLERVSEVLRRDYPICWVKAEGLCKAPEETMTSIYNYLEIDAFDHDFDNIEQLTKENDLIHGPLGDHTIRRKLEPLKPKAYEILGEQNVDMIRQKYAAIYDSFQYLTKKPVKKFTPLS